MNLRAVPKIDRAGYHESNAEQTQAKKKELETVAVETLRQVIDASDEKLVPEKLDPFQKKQFSEQVYNTLLEVLEQKGRLLSQDDKQKVIQQVLDEIFGFGPINELIEDPTVTEIMINGFDNIYIERKGKLVKSEITFRDNAHVSHTINKIINPLGRRVDESCPTVDARLPDGSRVNAIIPPLSLRGPCVTIRKFSKDPFKVNDLVNFNSLTAEMADFLASCVRARLNMLVSGGTGSGKTTTLNVLSSFIPGSERIVTVEDTAELQLHQDNLVTLESRPANMEGKGQFTIRELVVNCLRMRPDRIVVGEVRGGEALDMLQAMNTGHDGSISTLHANSPRDALTRLETMVLMAGMELPLRAIREQISSAVNLIVQQSRLSDGSRKITRISEVLGLEGDTIKLQDIFIFKQDSIEEDGRIQGRHIPTGVVPFCMEKLQSYGENFVLEDVPGFTEAAAALNPPAEQELIMDEAAPETVEVPSINEVEAAAACDENIGAADLIEEEEWEDPATAEQLPGDQPHAAYLTQDPAGIDPAGTDTEDDPSTDSFTEAAAALNPPAEQELIMDEAAPETVEVPSINEVEAAAACDENIGAADLIEEEEWEDPATAEQQPGDQPHAAYLTQDPAAIDTEDDPSTEDEPSTGPAELPEASELQLLSPPQEPPVSENSMGGLEAIIEQEYDSLEEKIDNSPVEDDGNLPAEDEDQKADPPLYLETGAPSQAEIGQDLAFEVFLRNRGEENIYNIYISDEFLEWNARIDALAPGESRTFEVECYASCDRGGVLSGTTTVRAETFTGDKISNSCSYSVQVLEPEVSIAVAAPTGAAPGDQISLDFTVTNRSPHVDLFDLQLSDNSLRWSETVENLPAGESCFFQAECEVPAEKPEVASSVSLSAATRFGEPATARQNWSFPVHSIRVELDQPANPVKLSLVKTRAGETESAYTPKEEAPYDTGMPGEPHYWEGPPFLEHTAEALEDSAPALKTPETERPEKLNAVNQEAAESFEAAEDVSLINDSATTVDEQPATTASRPQENREAYAVPRVPRGMRAFALPVCASTGLFRYIQPGDRVDVLVVTPVEKPVYSTVENVVLLAVDGLGDGDKSAVTVILAVKPAQLQELACAFEGGSFQLVLRSAEDDGRISSTRVKSECGVISTKRKKHKRQ